MCLPILVSASSIGALLERELDTNTENTQTQHKHTLTVEHTHTHTNGCHSECKIQGGTGAPHCLPILILDAEATLEERSSSIAQATQVRRHFPTCNLFAWLGLQSCSHMHRHGQSQSHFYRACQGFVATNVLTTLTSSFRGSVTIFIHQQHILFDHG